MRRVDPARDAEGTVARLRSALRPGAPVATEGDGKTVVRRRPPRRCKATQHRAAGGATGELAVTQEAPGSLAAVVPRWIRERTVATEVAAARLDRHGEPGGPRQP